MDDGEGSVAARMAGLEQENAQFLEELETVYRQVEEHLLASEREQEIAYQELRDRNRHLQNRLEELQAANLELSKTQQMLIRSERLAAMGEMASAVVHEIKNPLSIILGHAELIGLHTDVATQERGLKAIRKAGEYLGELAENILRFARHHQGEAHHLDLNTLLIGLQDLMKPIVRGVDFVVELHPDLPQVLADRSQVEQTLMNLILNAQDAMEKTGRLWLRTGRSSIQAAVEQERSAGRPCKLAVEIDEDLQAMDFVFAEVQDSGPGISGEHMDRIFEAFFTTKGEVKGTGLGLSIVRTIVSGWGGEILVSSRKGEGASFRVFLPPASAEV